MGVLANRIVKARERKGWTQGQLATYSRVNQSSISKIEGGLRTNVGVDALAKIARVLETSMEYLVGLTDDPRPLAVIQSSESRELASQVGELLAEPDVEELFKLILRMTPEQKASMRAFAMFLVGLHNT